MYYLANHSHDPYYNLALEEYVFRNWTLAEPCLLLWQNEPTVVIGRFQNTMAEINREFVEQHQIQVVRRITGGGAVYHDLGNLNFTFIVREKVQDWDFRKFTEPVLQALGFMGIPAEYSGRNDLTIQGKKFSGNAQYHHRGKTMHHGTLLFAADLRQVGQVLCVQGEKLQSKGVKSVGSRVTNISEHLPNPMTMAEFKALLLRCLFRGEVIKEYFLTEKDFAKIKDLRVKKYLTYSWNYGSSPPFNFRKKRRFPCGEIEVCLEIKAGLIRECKFYGDFFSHADLADLEKKIIDLPYREDVLADAIKPGLSEKYFNGLKMTELLPLFFP